MKHIPILLLFALALPQVILSGCPQPVGLGPRTDDDKSLCAIMYEHAHDDSNTSCYGDQLQVKNGEEANSIANGWNDKVSSLVVRDGCTLSGYQDGNFGGRKKDFTGMHYYLGHEHYAERFNWNDRISSYICKCWFKPVDCEPEDNWKQVVSCDNNSGNEDMTCKYFESHGINIGKGFSDEHTTSESISANVGAEIGMMFAKASASASASLTTTYSWSESLEFGISEIQGVEVEVHVSAGSHIGVYQIQGVCGDSTTKTQCFQSRDEDTKLILSSTCPEL